LGAPPGGTHGVSSRTGRSSAALCALPPPASGTVILLAPTACRQPFIHPIPPPPCTSVARSTYRGSRAVPNARTPFPRARRTAAPRHAGVVLAIAPPWGRSIQPRRRSTPPRTRRSFRRFVCLQSVLLPNGETLVYLRTQWSHTEADESVAHYLDSHGLSEDQVHKHRSGGYKYDHGAPHSRVRAFFGARARRKSPRAAPRRGTALSEGSAAAVLFSDGRHAARAYTDALPYMATCPDPSEDTPHRIHFNGGAPGKYPREVKSGLHILHEDMYNLLNESK
jgi:hypothetical protein